MELEAENLWVQSTRHDFDDKKKSSKNSIFLIENNFRKKFAIFKKYFFETQKNSKIFIENQYKLFQKSRKKSRFFRDFFDFFENVYIHFQ